MYIYIYIYMVTLAEVPAFLALATQATVQFLLPTNIYIYIYMCMVTLAEVPAFLTWQCVL